MNLEELKQSVSTMSETELRELLGSIRQSRRTIKAKPAVAKERKPTVSKSGADALLGSLTKEQAAALLEILGGK